MTLAKRRDFFNLLSLLSADRILNLLKLLLSYWHSLAYKRVWMWGLPWALSIEPGNTCTLRCPECPTGSGKHTRPKGLLSKADFENIIKHIPPSVFYVNLYFMGEPLLNPELPEMIRILKARKIYVSLHTNAQNLGDDLARSLVKAGLDRLHVSLDGQDQSSYEKYRKGGDIQRVVSGISYVSRARKLFMKKRPLIMAQTLLLQSTENQLDTIKALALKSGADFMEVKTALFNLDAENCMLLPENEKYSRYFLDESGRMHIKNKRPNHCFRMWTSAVITWEGDVVPCCYDKNAEFPMGNVIKKPLREIWRGPVYLAFRKKIFKNRKAVNICNNCNG